MIVVSGCYLIAKGINHRKFGPFIERTEKGHELAEKAAAFQRFIHEYSLLSQRELAEAANWQDFLVYAIVLEENVRIIKEISKLYKHDMLTVLQSMKY
jgi:uncharacterized membrane protein